MKNLLPEQNKPLKGHIKVNRKGITFLLCLLIAVLFWLLNALSKYYNTTVPISIKYINMPVSKAVSNDLPNLINGLIRARGYRLLSYKFTPFNDTLELDLASLVLTGNDSMNYIVTSQITEKLSQQIKGNIKLLEINPDTLFFYFSNSASKMVPVKPTINLKFEGQYRLAKAITYTPESILVTGNANVIKNIKLAETEEIEFNAIDKNISAVAKIKNQNKKIKLSHEEIKLNIQVAKFTERSFEIPIVVKNIPKGISLRLYPEKTIVKFILPLENYEKTIEAMFTAEVDASDVLKNKEPKLKIQLTKQPEWIENISMAPAKAEYIIKK